jgi:hypothetical protein
MSDIGMNLEVMRKIMYKFAQDKKPQADNRSRYFMNASPHCADRISIHTEKLRKSEETFNNTKPRT